MCFFCRSLQPFLALHQRIRDDFCMNSNKHDVDEIGDHSMTDNTMDPTLPHLAQEHCTAVRTHSCQSLTFHVLCQESDIREIGIPSDCRVMCINQFLYKKMVTMCCYGCMFPPSDSDNPVTDLNSIGIKITKNTVLQSNAPLEESKSPWAATTPLLVAGEGYGQCCVWSQWSLDVWNKMAVLTPSKLYAGTNIYILTEHALTCLHSLCAHMSETSSLNANSDTFVVYCRYCVWWHCWLALHQHHSNRIMQLRALFSWLPCYNYIYSTACMCVHMYKYVQERCKPMHIYIWYIYPPPHTYMHIYPRSLIRPWLVSLRTWLIGVPTIGLQAVILLKIYCTINNPTQLLSQTINMHMYVYPHFPPSSATSGSDHMIVRWPLTALPDPTHSLCIWMLALWNVKLIDSWLWCKSYQKHYTKKTRIIVTVTVQTSRVGYNKECLHMSHNANAHRLYCLIQCRTACFFLISSTRRKEITQGQVGHVVSYYYIAYIVSQGMSQERGNLTHTASIEWSSSTSSLQCCCAMSASAIALRRTSQVQRSPWVSIHLCSPSWIASTSFRGLLW